MSEKPPVQNCESRAESSGQEHAPQLANPAAILHGCFFLAGPTAVGKTEIAVSLAEACNGEIVGADAFQVYRGLDLLTAKPASEALSRVPHHLVGTVPLTETFSVARYLGAALHAIAEIQSRGRCPIITGGTGLYIRALTRGLSDAPPSSPELRTELDATPLPQLLARLESVDPDAARVVDRNNPRRIRRALEVVLLSGKPFSSFRQEWEQIPQFHGVFLERSREELYARINQRTVAMFEQGVVEEVRDAITSGAVGATAQQVIGWSQIEALLRGEISEAGCISAVQQATRHYAKRQSTWFRREPMLIPVSLTATNDNESSLQKVVAIAKASLCLE